MLDATRMLEEAYGRGRYHGGYTQTAADGTTRSEDEPDTPLYDNTEAMQLLREIARNTGTSLTIRDVRREIRHEEQLERNAGR